LLSLKREFAVLTVWGLFKNFYTHKSTTNCKSKVIDTKLIRYVCVNIYQLSIFKKCNMKNFTPEAQTSQFFILLNIALKATQLGLRLGMGSDLYG